MLVWFLAFAATLALIFAGVYSVGQVTSEKQKVVNAADAAAYSGALVEARALNLVAYTNRAVIANEVLIAQAISLQSWLDYFGVVTGNIQKVLDVLQMIPYVNTVAAVINQVVSALNSMVSEVQSVLNTGIPYMIRGWELMFRTWYDTTIETAFAPGAMAVSANAAAQAVVAQNVATQDGRQDQPAHLIDTFELGALNTLAWNNFTKTYTGDDRQYAKDLLLASRDAFSTNRPGTTVPIWDLLFGNADACPLVPIGSEKKGSTTLVNYDRWEAQDTLEYKTESDCFFGKWNYAPIGWGRSVADKDGTEGSRLGTPGGAGDLAYYATRRNKGWSGVKELRDVTRNSNGQPEKNPAELTYAVAVAKGKADIRTNDNASLNFMTKPWSSASATGSADLTTGFAKDQVMAMAEARVFFARPVRNARDITAGGLVRADSYQEYASLYNPYWQVRLSSPSAATSAEVYGFTGLNPALSAFTQ